MSTARIKFNVGGTKYEVSESVLDRFPESMLKKISSKTWEEGAKDETTDEIFIDRNGLRFQYVLDFMRDSRVELPLSIPKGQLLIDLDFFGIDYGDGSAIVLSVSNPKDLFHSLGTYRDYFDEKSAEIEKRYFDVAVEMLAYDIASEYFSQLGRPSAKQISSPYSYSVKDAEVQEPVRFFQTQNVNVKMPLDHSSHQFTPVLLNKHLLKVGLSCHFLPRGYNNSSQPSSHTTFGVTTLPFP